MSRVLEEILEHRHREREGEDDEPPKRAPTCPRGVFADVSTVAQREEELVQTQRGLECDQCLSYGFVVRDSSAESRKGLGGRGSVALASTRRRVECPS